MGGIERAGLAQRSRDSIASSLETIRSATPLNTHARPELTGYGFEELAYPFGQLQALASRVHSSHLNLLSDDQLRDLAEDMEAMAKSISGLKDAVPAAHPNPRDWARGAINTFIDRFDRLHARSGGAVALAVASWNPMQEELYALNKRTGDAVAKMEVEFGHVAKDAKELRTLMEGAREEILGKGIESGASHFKSLADIHRSAGRRWLVAVALFFSLTCGATWYLLTAVHQETENLAKESSRAFSLPALIAGLVARLTVVTVAYTAFLWCSRTYRVHKHLEEANRHREMALKTMLAFREATEEQATRNAVILEATRCVFAQGQTGYLGKDGTASGSPVPSVVQSIMASEKAT